MTLAAYRAHLATGATTRARCWRLTRRDGVVIAATDHDRDLAFDGSTFRAGTGFRGSEIARGLGLSVDDGEAEGALSTGEISAADIAAGLFDGARVEVFEVNWSDPSARKLVGVYTVGEIETGEGAFRAEVRGIAARLGQREGRVYGPLCDAALGDARCGVDLTASAFSGVGTITGGEALAFTVTGLDGFDSGWFAAGRVEWGAGPNAGQRSDVRGFTNLGASQILTLWRPPVAPIVAGATFTARAGCAKTWETCRAKFANGANFRGFPHMPGDSAVAEYATTGDPRQDGGSRQG